VNKRRRFGALENLTFCNDGVGAKKNQINRDENIIIICATCSRKEEPPAKSTVVRRVYIIYIKCERAFCQSEEKKPNTKRNKTKEKEETGR